MLVKVVQMSSSDNVEYNISKSIDMAGKSGHADITVFPEYQMVVPDFSSPEKTISLAETEDGRFVSSMKELSRDGSTVVICNGTIRDDSIAIRNRSLIIKDGSIIWRYDKTHLYDAAGGRESLIYRYGVLPFRPVQIDDFQAGILICYDIRFPDASRSLAVRGADLIIYQAGWFSGKGKLDQWKTLLKARAIETGCYVIGCAQTGTKFTGHSMVVDPYGRIAGSLGKEEGLLMVEISKKLVSEYREKYPLMNQRRTDLYSGI